MNITIKDRVEAAHDRGYPGTVMDVQGGIAEVQWDDISHVGHWMFQNVDDLISHQLQ